MVLPAETPLHFLAARRRGHGEYVETGEYQPTLEALRWAAEISWLLGAEQVEPAPFIDRCRRLGGAFAMTAREDEPSRAASYYAVRVLTLCEMPGRIPAELPSWFISELAAPDRPAASDIDEMFYVLRALEQLGALDSIPARVRLSLVGFIRECQDMSGGFAASPGLPPDTEHTYCASCGLLLLGQPLSHADASVTARWLNARFNTASGLATLTSADDLPSLAASYWGFRAGEVIGATVWTSRLREAVEELRKPDGGYGTAPVSTLWESYCALRVISRLHVLAGHER